MVQAYKDQYVAPRKGRGSRNDHPRASADRRRRVAPRKGRVSRNKLFCFRAEVIQVAPRKGRVSRNQHENRRRLVRVGRAPQGACE